MKYVSSVTMLTSLLMLYGCVAPRPIDLHAHSYEFEVMAHQIVFETDMPELEVKARLANLVTADPPTHPIYWSCGIGATRDATTKMTKFTIVGITEQYVPITGEIKGLIFHVKMSP